MNEGVVGTLFGVSILTATIRTTYRIQTNNGRLLFDDFMLIFACVTLTAATGLLYVLIPKIYSYEEEIVKHELNVRIEMVGYRQLVLAFVSLTWGTIFLVKICLLLFFLQLVDHLKKLMFLWKIVFAITIVIFCFCVSGNFIASQHLGRDNPGKSRSFSQHRSSQETNNESRILFLNIVRYVVGYPWTVRLAFSFTENTLDIVTDMLSEFWQVFRVENFIALF